MKRIPIINNYIIKNLNRKCNIRLVQLKPKVDDLVLLLGKFITGPLTS